MRLFLQAMNQEGMKGKDLLNLVRDRLPVKPKLNVVLWNADNIKVGTQTIPAKKTDMFLNACHKLHEFSVEDGTNP